MKNLNLKLAMLALILASAVVMSFTTSEKDTTDKESKQMNVYYVTGEVTMGGGAPGYTITTFAMLCQSGNDMPCEIHSTTTLSSPILQSTVHNDPNIFIISTQPRM